MLPIIRAQLVTVNIDLAAGTGAGASIPFPDQPILNGTYIMGWEAFDVTDLTTAPNRRPIVSAADSLVIAVTLNDGSNLRYKRMPYTSLRTITHAGVWKECDPTLIDFQKSVVEFFANSAAAALYSLAFMFYYATPTDMVRLGLKTKEEVLADGFQV